MEQTNNEDNRLINYDLIDLTTAGKALLDITNWRDCILWLVEVGERLIAQCGNAWNGLKRVLQTFTGNGGHTCCQHCREIMAVYRPEMDGISLNMNVPKENENFAGVTGSLRHAATTTGAKQIGNIPGDSVFSGSIGTARQGEEIGSITGNSNESIKCSYILSLPPASKNHAKGPKPYSVLTVTEPNVRARTCPHNIASLVTSPKTPVGSKVTAKTPKTLDRNSTNISGNAMIETSPKTPVGSKADVTAKKPKTARKTGVQAQKSMKSGRSKEPTMDSQRPKRQRKKD